MDKRYQVFVSSTYADLQQERQRVIQTLMEMDCIPAGMELFPAADEEQWQFIKRIIDDCDYYVLIIGGRYGSLTPEGISYTEKEYDYAQSIGLNVLAFVHEAPDEIPVGKSDIDPLLRGKLSAFREKVSGTRLVKFWRSAAELPGLVALSLSKTIKVHPAVGWVRASNVANDELLRDLNTLRKENETLRSAVGTLQEAVGPRPHDSLAGLDEAFDVKIQYSVYDHYAGQSHTKTESHRTTWADLFARIAPDLLEHPNDVLVASHLGTSIYKTLHPTGEKTADVEHDCFQTIKIQLSAQNLISVTYTQTTKGGMALFWSLTARGQRVMLQLRTVKTASNKPSEATS
jgi:hypothetical protein